MIAALRSEASGGCGSPCLTARVSSTPFSCTPWQNGNAVGSPYALALVWQVSTKDELDALVALDVFKYDPEYNTHEKEYEVGWAAVWA